MSDHLESSGRSLTGSLTVAECLGPESHPGDEDALVEVEDRPELGFDWLLSVSSLSSKSSSYLLGNIPCRPPR